MRYQRPFFILSASLLLGLVVKCVAGCNLILGLGDYTDACPEVAEGKACPDAGLCTPGEKVACYTGPSDTSGKGICKSGQKTCGSDGLFGQCEGEVTPKAKDICGNGLDDDCNGKIDDACHCTPGSKSHCYGADPSTEDAGVCHGGTHVCEASGQGYGACTGEKTPGPEDYQAPGDEDCNGIPSADTQWVETFSAQESDGTPVGLFAFGAGVDDQGDVFVDGMIDTTGGVQATATFGSFTVVGAAPPNVGFLAKLHSDGTPAWAKPTTKWGPIAAAHDGSVRVGGALLNAFDSSGAPLWSVSCTGSGSASTLQVVVDAQGNAYVGGQVTGTAACGGVSLASPSASVSAFFVAQIDSSGHVAWGHAFGEQSGLKSESFGGLAIAPNGNVWVTGQLQGTLTVASTNGPEVELIDHGGGDAFVIELTPAGKAVTAGSWGDTSAQAGTAIWIHPTGNDYRVMISGSNAGTIDLGGGNLAAAGNQDGFVAAFGSALTPLWSSAFGGSGGTATPVDAFVEPHGETVVVGDFRGQIAFGATENKGPFSAGAARYVFLATLDGNGGYVWSKYYGGSTGSAHAGVTVVAATVEPLKHYAVLAGTFVDATDFGTGSKAEAGYGSVFVSKVASP